MVTLSALRRSFVLTASVGLTQCAPTTPPRPSGDPDLPAPSSPAPWTQTPPDPGCPDGESTEPVQVSTPVSTPKFPDLVNPIDACGRIIFRNRNGKCFVEVPPIDDRPVGFSTHPTDCPAAIQDPAFDNCLGGAVLTDGEACSCLVYVNPPPPPRDIPCPRPGDAEAPTESN